MDFEAREFPLLLPALRSHTELLGVRTYIKALFVPVLNLCRYLHTVLTPAEHKCENLNSASLYMQHTHEAYLPAFSFDKNFEAVHSGG